MNPRIKTILTSQPYVLFIIVALILFIISFFVKEIIVDIHSHDTMYVLSLTHILWMIIILLLLGWLIYKIAARVLWSKYLTWFHVMATLGFFVLFVIACWWQPEPPGQELNYKIIRQQLQRERIIISSILIIFIVAQICFLVNIVGGLLGKLVQKS
jgi:hypothetical protein